MTRTQVYSALLALTVVLMATGCASVSRSQDFDMSLADQVKLNESTKEEVLKLFEGVKPALVKSQDDGGEVWVFQFMESSFLKHRLKQFSVGFDKEGIVRSIYRRDGLDRSKR